jgi:hypothetical protein
MSTKFREHLRELAADIEFRCRAARDAHFLAARRWDSIGLWLGLSVVLVGVVGGGGGGIYTSNATIAAVFAVMAGLLGAVSSFLKPSELVGRHKKAGDDWSVLRDSAANIYKLQIEHSSDVSDDQLQTLYDTLLAEKKKVTEDSPIIPTWAYDSAFKKLKPKQ